MVHPVTRRVLSVPLWAGFVAFLALALATRMLEPSSVGGIDLVAARWVLSGTFVVWAFAKGSTELDPVETDAETPAAPGEHYRHDGGTVPPGVYRVVGTGEEVTLLRVTEDGDRAHTGQLERVDQSTLEAAFEPASDPDASVALLGSLRDGFASMYWVVRSRLR